MTRYSPVLWVMCTASLLASACSKKAAQDSYSAPPGEAGATGDELAALEEQLTRRENQLSAMGLNPTARLSKKAAGSTGASQEATAADATAPVSAPSPASSPAEDAAKPDAGGDRCTQVCEITTAICALEDQICGLLPRHPGEARYQAACDRSNADCQLATEACHACTGN